MKTILGAQIRAARALLRWSASDLVRESGVSLSTIHRAEAVDGETAMTFANAASVRRAFENAGVEIIEEHRAGPGARLKHPLSEHKAPEVGRKTQA
jgi:transcriptional regulator with XRE-family HTH domain